MSPMEGGVMPKPSEQAKAAFTRLVPDGPSVTLRPMFGNLAAFVNGNMFAGLFGEDLFVPASEPGRSRLGYVTVPSTWRGKPEAVKGWIAIALELTGRMPPKVPAAKKAVVKKLK